MTEFFLTNSFGALIVGLVLGAGAHRIWGVKEIHVKPSHRAMFETLVEARIRTLTAEQARRGMDHRIEELAKQIVAESDRDK